MQQKHSSLSSLTQLALSLVHRLWLKLIKRSPFQDFSLLAGDEARTRDILLGKEAFYHWITPAFLSVVYPLYMGKKNMQVPFLNFFKIPKDFLIYLIFIFKIICLRANLLL